MNTVDLLLLALLAAAVVHGLTLGAAAQVISFAGLWGGLALAAVLAPHVRELGDDPTTRLALLVATLIASPAVTTTAARVLGVKAWRAIQRARLGKVDAAAGALLAATATLVLSSLVASVIARVPDPTVATAIQQSEILRTADRVLPPTPALFARIGRLLDPLGFPDVFAGLEPAPPADLPPPADPVVRAAVARARPSVVQIRGEACGAGQRGSGFVVRPGLVVTNAHVVAGVARPTIVDRRGVTHRARAVFFDPRLDLAVLEASTLRAPTLGLAPAVDRGAQGAVMGYPHGGPFRAGGAVVLSRRDALGRDIYGRSLTTRTIYLLRAEVEPGNSGGPVVDAAGTVIGVVFARSAANSDIGYALPSDEVTSRIRPALEERRRVSTGECAA